MQIITAKPGTSKPRRSKYYTPLPTNISLGRRPAHDNPGCGISVTGDAAQINPPAKVVNKRIPGRPKYPVYVRPKPAPGSSNEAPASRARERQMNAIVKILNLVNDKTHHAADEVNMLADILAEETYSEDQLNQAKNILADSLDGLVNDHVWKVMVQQIRNRDIDFTDRSNILLKPLSQYLKHR